MDDNNGSPGARGLVFLGGLVLILAFLLRGDLDAATLLGLIFCTWIASLFF
jgi:hypothetical protein